MSTAVRSWLLHRGLVCSCLSRHSCCLTSTWVIPCCSSSCRAAWSPTYSPSRSTTSCHAEYRLMHTSAEAKDAHLWLCCVWSWHFGQHRRMVCPGRSTYGSQCAPLMLIVATTCLERGTTAASTSGSYMQHVTHCSERPFITLQRLAV
jgi:hypothetical protein